MKEHLLTKFHETSHCPKADGKEREGIGMISDSEFTPLRASSYLGIRFWDIRKEIKTLSDHNNFAGVLQAVVNSLRNLVAKRKFKAVSRRIGFVESVYQKGNPYIRYLIENLFILSFNGIRRQTTPMQWQLLFRKLPDPFKKLYTIQIENKLNNKPIA